jgi:hypothetical protein
MFSGSVRSLVDVKLGGGKGKAMGSEEFKALGSGLFYEQGLHSCQSERWY